MTLPWDEPRLKMPEPDGLYLLVVNSKILAGVFVWKADKQKFFWQNSSVDWREVELYVPFRALVATLPVTAQARAVARAAHVERFLDMVAA